MVVQHFLLCFYKYRIWRHAATGMHKSGKVYHINKIQPLKFYCEANFTDQVVHIMWRYFNALQFYLGFTVTKNI